MTPTPHIISAIKALMAGYPEAHTARVIDAIKRGPRVTTEQLAHAARVHRCTIWAWVKAGKLPAPRKDSKWRRSWSYDEVSHLI